MTELRDDNVIPSESDVGDDVTEARSYSAPNHASTMFRRVREFRASHHLCDVTLVVGSLGLSSLPLGGDEGDVIPTEGDVTEVRAHRLVLAAASDYFAAMFTNIRLVEARSSRIEMRDVEPSALVNIVEYIYSGVIELKEDNVESILATAGLLQLPDLVDACCTFFVKQLHPSNCCGIRSFADAQGCLDLLKAADSYIIDNFLDVIQHQEFLLLPLAQVIQLLSSEDLNVDNEEVVFHSMLRWVFFDMTARKPVVSTLLECIKLPLLVPQFISEHIEYNGLFKSDAHCQELVMEALMCNLMPERRFTSFDRKKMKPRKATLGTLYAIGGMDFSRGATGIERYNYRKNQWTSVGELRGGKRLQFGAAVIGAKIYVVGGRDGLKTLSTMECYHPAKNQWTSLAPMMTPRHGLGVAVLEGPLYAVGGHDGWSYLNTVERWDPQVKTWSFVAQMTIPRSTVGVVSLGFKLYAIGGRDGNNCLQSVESYDPYSNKWTLCAPMSVKRGCVGVATCNGFIFAVGGHQSSSKTLNALFYDCAERYDPKTDTWTTVCCMNIPRDAVGLCSLGPDVVVAVGGYDGQNYLKSVEVYDPFTNEWSFLASLNAGRAGTCVVCVPLDQDGGGVNKSTVANRSSAPNAISITVNDDSALPGDIVVTASTTTDATLSDVMASSSRDVMTTSVTRDGLDLGLVVRHSPFHFGPTFFPPVDMAVMTTLMDQNLEDQ